MAPTRAEFVEWARAQLGTREEPPGSNWTIYHQIMGAPRGWAWCGLFLEAGAKVTGLILPGRTYYTPSGARAFKDAGRWGTAPKVGAFAYLYYASKGRIAHVGVVEAVHSDGRVTLIEGNTTLTDDDPFGYVVARHKRRALVPAGQTGICGYGYPAYAPDKTRTEVDLVAELPELRRGDGMGSRTSRREDVQSMQHLLLARGAKLRKYGPDGMFGGETENALESVTGSSVCRAREWRKLLRL